MKESPLYHECTSDYRDSWFFVAICDNMLFYLSSCNPPVRSSLVYVSSLSLCSTVIENGVLSDVVYWIQ